jgi:hypothetical protein
MTGVKVTQVDYIVNPPLVKNFERKRLELAGHVDWDDTKPILAFVRLIPACVGTCRLCMIRRPTKASFVHTAWHVGREHQQDLQGQL